MSETLPQLGGESEVGKIGHSRDPFIGSFRLRRTVIRRVDFYRRKESREKMERIEIRRLLTGVNDSLPILVQPARRSKVDHVMAAGNIPARSRNVLRRL
jgi:hypothetical protein